MRLDSNKEENNRVHISGAPSPAYSLATGFAFYIVGSIAFHIDKSSESNTSSVLISPLITQKHQFSIPIQFSIWAKKNKYDIVGDWRMMAYPEDTYGLGGLTYEGDTVNVNYKYIRSYTFVLKKIGKDFYAGLGYQLDAHWNIQQTNAPPNTITNFDKYGFSNRSVSSGVSADFLFDNRKNSINPEAGTTYGNIVFRQNLHALGSDENWESLLIDIRKYIHLIPNSNNILALWSYDWLTVSGNPPYLDLPSTGWDTYGNMGRGYIQSRFRSKNMLDLEAEYRFGILHNGLLGGVVFGNAQSYSEINNNRFEAIQPAIGTGLRIKFNKFSKTNICLDYAFGLHGSNGLFVNLGEVF